MRIAAALCALVAACGASTPAAPVDGHVDALIQLPDAAVVTDRCAGAVAAADFAACAGQALCARRAACGLGQAGDTDCAALPLALFGGVPGRSFADAVATATALGHATYDPIGAAACLERLRATSCRSLGGDGALPLDGCAVFVGRIAVGSSCGYPFECAGGAVCVTTWGNQYDPLCGQDVCKAPVAPGQSCASAPCQAGDHCVSGVCATGDLGANCSGDLDCDPDFSCGSDGTCVAAGGDGAACTRDRQCAGELLCVGETVPPQAGVCHDVSVAGATCDRRCTGPYLCTTTGSGSLGTCVDEPAVGAPCVPGVGCGPLLMMVCDDAGTPADPSDDRCRMAGERGAACTATGGGCNVDLFCSTEISGAATGVCVGPLATGTVCTRGDQCASEICTNQFCAAPVSCTL